jgi:hypothetical protein
MLSEKKAYAEDLSAQRDGPSSYEKVHLDNPNSTSLINSLGNQGLMEHEIAAFQSSGQITQNQAQDEYGYALDNHGKWVKDRQNNDYFTSQMIDIQKKRLEA